MNTFFRHLSLTLALGLAAFSIQAEEIRIGFINTDRIFKEANTAKQAQAKLEQEFAKRDKDLIEFGNNLKSSAE
jgi:outer membrane protein